MTHSIGSDVLTAQRRGDGEDDDGDAEDPFRPEPVGEPAADANADGERQQVHGHREVDVHRTDPEFHSHARCSGLDDRRVENLHERSPGDEERKRPVKGGP
jgi:hypothetical protein